MSQEESGMPSVSSLVLSFVFKILESLHLHKLFERLCAPLEVEVLSFSAFTRRDRPNGSCVILTSCPDGYSAEVSLTNRSDKVVWIKQFALTIGGQEGEKEPESREALRLDPGQPRTHHLAYHDEAPKASGSFRIRVVPTRGRPTEVSANFPL